MRPGEVLDAQIDLIERLKDPFFRDVYDAFGQFDNNRNGGFKKKEMGRQNNTPQSEMLSNCLKAAHTYRVSHDMSVLVEQAATTLDDLSQFDSKWAPSGCGFVAFDRPLPVKEVRGKTMLIHFLIWGPVRTTFKDTGRMETATLVMTFNDRWRQPDEVDGDMETYWLQEGGTESWERAKHVLGRWASLNNEPMFNGQRMGPAQTPPSKDYIERLLLEGAVAQPTTNVMRYVHALWMMMNQTIAHVGVEKPDRPARRRAEKHRLPPKVTVIRLRREDQHRERQEGESQVEWQHRWWVKGHPRWQACGPNHPYAQEVSPGVFRAWIWIDPYEKGPEGAPLVQSQKVYSLER